MSGLTIGWEYLTGYAVATDPSSRERAEWPPHPGRVFMAMAAAFFETGQDAAEGDALRWIETLGDPIFYLPAREQVAERSSVTVYVPVNDKAGPATAMLQSAPVMRSKQPRSFPRVHVGDARCYVHWPQALGVKEHRDALDRLCSKVTRIGHSSSLVRMWVDDASPPNDTDCKPFTPDDQLADQPVRTISEGMLEMLDERFGEHSRRRHAELDEQIIALKADRKAARGKGAKERKASIDRDIKLLEERLAISMPRPPIRPTLGLWTGYRLLDSTAPQQDVEHTHFDTDLLVLTQVAGPTLPVVSTLAVTQALRGAVMSQKHIQPVPQWVSGHQADGSPCDADTGHLACIPLPHVDHKHADGHLLGVGLVFPRASERQERGRVLGPLLMKSDGQPREVALQLGQLGLWTVKKSDWSERRDTLQPETWTAHPNGAKTWASITPVVLDRFPKADHAKDRTAWTDEVATLVAAACIRIGLPEPVVIDIDTTCWHRGCPRAVAKRRPLRGPAGEKAAMGEGFAFYPAKGANASRPQVHVLLEFAKPVLGPILLGAGRYYGYGLCKPVHRSKEAGR